MSSKTGILTGASGGLGIAIARKLSPICERLIVTSSSVEKLEQLQARLTQEFPKLKVDTFKADLADRGEIDAFCEFITQNCSDIDFLINNAAKFSVKSISETNYNLLTKDFHINVYAPFLLSKALVESAKDLDGKHLIFIGSSSAYGASANTSVYSATKHSLLGVSRAFDAEYRGKGLRTLFVAPGSIQTDMGRQVEGQNFSTFIEPEDLAEFVRYNLTLGSNMILNEVRVNRMQYE